MNSKTKSCRKVAKRANLVLELVELTPCCTMVSKSLEFGMYDLLKRSYFFFHVLGSLGLSKHVLLTCPMYGRPLLLQSEHSSSSFDFLQFAVL